MELNWYKEGEVLVLRSSDLQQLRSFFEGFGLRFAEEKHGSGPLHYVAQAGSRVLEIYPEKMTSKVRRDPQER